MKAFRVGEAHLILMNPRGQYDAVGPMAASVTIITRISGRDTEFGARGRVVNASRFGEVDLLLLDPRGHNKRLSVLWRLLSPSYPG